MHAPDESRYPGVTRLLEEAVLAGVFPGCSYGVLTSRSKPWAAAVGRFTYEPDAAEVSPDTVYDLASLTKVLATTAAAMVLWERGRLLLDAPLVDLLPEFAASDPRDTRRSRVTVRMLLDHSSGLPGYVRLFEHVNGRHAMIDACLHQPLTADPGTRAEYSDLGFILLGYLLEQISGERLDVFCAREIFSPLGMCSTVFCPPSHTRDKIPPTEDDHTFRHRVIQGEVHDENASEMGGVAGHAGLFSNAIDPLRLASCMLGEGNRLFRAETISLFSRRVQQPPGSSRALGWDTPSSPSSSGSFFSAHSIGHLGFTGTSLWIDLKAGVAITLLTNRTWRDRSNQAIRALRPRFHDAVRDAIQQEILASQDSG